MPEAMTDEGDPEAIRRRVDDLQRQIDSHPARIEHHAIEALNESLNHVWRPNLAELEQLLVAPSQDQGLAIELIQNVKAPVVRDRFIASVLRATHNYVASTQSLVEHVRTVMRNRSGDTAAAFTIRRRDLAKDSSVAFFKDLRNFTLHRSLPPLTWEFRVADLHRPDAFEFDFRVPVSALRLWSGWSASSRSLLAEREGGLSLEPLLRRHGAIVLDLNSWLIDRLLADGEAGRAVVNELITRQEMLITGLDRGEVLRRIRDRSDRSDYPQGEGMHRDS
ncbi:hypothetical protein [Miltoncostaea oceani]|uniref:hypothetical protein n=1 Tax=Miltoncostaea oceani TaxID=2843216 RepID=UPI001C3CB5C6|nr:hypothetical protein [Miltoncostaea oceani]